MRLALLVLVGCDATSANLYGEADWEPRSAMGMIRARQAQAGEAIVEALFWQSEVAPPEILPQVGSCEVREFPDYTYSPRVQAGNITLSAGGDQALMLVYDADRGVYRRDPLVPLTIEPGVAFSVTAAGAEIGAFSMTPAFTMPSVDVELLRPDATQGEVAFVDPLVLTWTGSDAYAQIVLQIRGIGSRDVVCVFEDTGSTTLSFSEAPLDEFRPPIAVTVERRRTRYADLEEGRLLLQSSYSDVIVMDE